MIATTCVDILSANHSVVHVHLDIELFRKRCDILLLFSAFEMPLEEGLKFEKRFFHQTFGTVSLKDAFSQVTRRACANEQIM